MLDSKQYDPTLFTEILDNLTVGIALFSPIRSSIDFKLSAFNRPCLDLFEHLGFSPIGHKLGDILPQSTAARLQQLFASLTPATPTGVLEEHYCSKRDRWLFFKAFLLTNGHIACVLEDISTQHEALEALKASEQRLQEAQNLAHLGNWHLNLQTGQADWSEEEFRLLGYEPHSIEPSAENFMKAVHPDDREAVQNEMQRVMDPNQTHPYRIEHRIALPNGERIVDQRGKVTFDELGKPVSMFGTTVDITDIKKAEQQIEFLALHDHLTGLPNRFALEEHLKQTLLNAQRQEFKVSVIFLDIDNFKIINDTMGHHTGDQVLIEVSERIQSCIRKSDMLARLSGDEFIIIMPQLKTAMDVTPVIEKIQAKLALPIAVNREKVHANCSIGISVYPDDGLDSGTLMKVADTAMYHAKEMGRNNFQFYEQSMNESALAFIELENDLKNALKQQTLQLYYQPIVNQQAQLMAFEALVRWHHPKHGYISPEKFIPIAEKSGQIEQLGYWVLNEACRQLKLWHQHLNPTLRMAVNLSPNQLKSANLVNTVQSILTSHQLDGHCLTLEITESTAMNDSDIATRQLNALNQLGINIAVDDFGTGYSSLAHLKLLPIQELKLDRSFVNDIETDPNDAAICEATLALAHKLDMKVVSEGIETAHQKQFLSQHHSDFLQGYLFSKPQPASYWTSKTIQQLRA